MNVTKIGNKLAQRWQSKISFVTKRSACWLTDSKSHQPIQQALLRIDPACIPCRDVCRCVASFQSKYKHEPCQKRGEKIPFDDDKLIYYLNGLNLCGSEDKQWQHKACKICNNLECTEIHRSGNELHR